MIEGWYYLHENGDVIFKSDYEGVVADLRESDFVKALWSFDSADRQKAWSILVESLSAGANKKRVQELADKWSCNDKDAEIFAERIGVKLSMDGNQFCAIGPGFINLQESPAGFGDTALEAMAELAKETGYVPRKMWGNSFGFAVQVSH